MWPLSRAFVAKSTTEPEPLLPIIVMVDGEALAVMLKRHAKARRMTLRQSRDGEHFVLTVPRRHSRKAAEAFLNASAGWMHKTRIKLPPAMPAADGGCILLRGEHYTIASTGKLRGLVSVNEDTRIITVPGAPSHMRRRLTEWLKCQAEKDLHEASQRYASAMNVIVKRLGVRDQKSRWGSCNADGVLSYSWRLVMAPPMVLDYVAAHEVAHLREMNHSPRFWKLVLSNCASARAAKNWLKQHGQTLHRMV
jgi:predicted metal-dependent hydrolase